MMKLGGRCIVPTELEFGGHSPVGVHPQQMWRWATTLGKSAQAVYSSPCVCCVADADVSEAGPRSNVGI